jgi:23S rRNA (guanosine2251-2'-O)-methyltransferase
MPASFPLVLLLSNIRSLYNVGSIFRTAEATGVQRIICAGITPYPQLARDPRPMFEADRTTQQIAKTALGAEKLIDNLHYDSSQQAVQDYQRQGYSVAVLEQSARSVNLFTYHPQFPLLLVLGHERDGVEPALIDLAQDVLEIPMSGLKESLNVSVAAGIALYYLRHQFT